MSAAERIARLRLARTSRVGPVAYRQLLAHHGSAIAALDALPGLAAKGGASAPLIPASMAEVTREIAALDKLGGRHLVLGAPEYPAILAACEGPPPVLCLLGHAHLLAAKAVAMVGARNASLNGRKIAEAMARDLGAAGLVVASGLARGIDGAAHQGALATGTIAVVAGGVDVVYPPEHQALHARIAAEGAIISEWPPQTQPTARHFPRRNRIISGLALGVVVVEAAERSGSLITARFAGEQGREVMAVPGSPLDPRAQGANRLIRDGATLVQNAADVLEALGHLLRGDFAGPPASDFAGQTAGGEPDDQMRQAVLTALGPSPVGVDELVRDLTLPAAMVQVILLELELAGRIERLAHARVALLYQP